MKASSCKFKEMAAGESNGGVACPIAECGPGFRRRGRPASRDTSDAPNRHITALKTMNGSEAALHSEDFVPHAIGIPVFVEEFVPQAIGIPVFVEELVLQAIEITPQSLRRPLV